MEQMHVVAGPSRSAHGHKGDRPLHTSSTSSMKVPQRSVNDDPQWDTITLTTAQRETVGGPQAGRPAIAEPSGAHQKSPWRSSIRSAFPVVPAMPLTIWNRPPGPSGLGVLLVLHEPESPGLRVPPP